MTKSPQRANCHFIFSVGLPHTQESYTISLTRGKHSRIQAEGKEEGWPSPPPPKHPFLAVHKAPVPIPHSQASWPGSSFTYDCFILYKSCHQSLKTD